MAEAHLVHVVHFAILVMLGVNTAMKYYILKRIRTILWEVRCLRDTRNKR